MHGIHLEQLPGTAVDGVLERIARHEVHQEYDGSAGYVPITGTDQDAVVFTGYILPDGVK